MQVLWDYTRIYNHVEYYFGYPDLYMEWYCTYWINGTCNKRQRSDMLPLLCLELSSILDEDPDNPEKTIEQAEFEKKIQNIQSSTAKTTLKGLDIYDNFAQTFYKKEPPYQSMDEFMDTVYDYVREHGPFSEDSFEKWLDQQLGAVDWDEVEW